MMWIRRHGKVFDPGKKSWEVGADLIKRHDMRGLLAPWIRLTTRKHLRPLDSFNTFDWIMEQSERHGLTSAFYLICGQQGSPRYCGHFYF